MHHRALANATLGFLSRVLRRVVRHRRWPNRTMPSYQLRDRLQTGLCGCVCGSLFRHRTPDGDHQRDRLQAGLCDCVRCSRSWAERASVRRTMISGHCSPMGRQTFFRGRARDTASGGDYDSNAPFACGSLRAGGRRPTIILQNSAYRPLDDGRLFCLILGGCQVATGVRRESVVGWFFYLDFCIRREYA